MSTVIDAPAYTSITDEEFVKSFPRYQGPGEAGFIIDFLGTRTRIGYVSSLAGASGCVEGYPIPGNFHATTLEWAGALRSVIDATTELVAVELGAGWAPWLVALGLVAKRRGISRVHLVGVEGSKQHCEYMLSHFADNGLEPDRHTLLHGVVGTADGVAEFPILLDPAADWGSRADYATGMGLSVRRMARKGFRSMKATIRSLVKGRAGPRSGVERVQCSSLPTLLRPFSRVDLLHVDIQGDEYEVLARSRQLLKDKVKRIVVGTHSRSIEEELLKELASQSWVLEAEESCQYKQDGRRMVLSIDGCQVWRNPAVARATVRRL